MPAKDKHHDYVRRVLENNGWTITDDPLYFKVGKVEVFMDLGAEKLIAAEKGKNKIAVEIKTFDRPSFITAFYEAIGKFITVQGSNCGRRT